MCSLSNKWIVYAHINKSNGKRYIGITSRSPEERWGKNGNQYTKSRNLCFYNAIQKYGWDGFEHIILYSGLSEKEAKEKEIELIAKYHSCVFDEKKQGYNMTFGGEGATGYKATEDSKKIRSINSTGEKNPFYGKHHSNEQKEEWSKQRKGKSLGADNPFYGKHHNEETIQKLSELASKRCGELNPNFNNHSLAGKNHPFYGKHHSEDTKKKISEARKGKSNSGKKIKCIENGKEYNTIKSAALELNVDASSIGKCCKGIFKSVKGYHFEFI